MGCRWINVTSLPKGLASLDQLTWTRDPWPGMDDPAAEKLIEHVVKEIILGGEEAADAVAIINSTEWSFASYEGHNYTLITSTAEGNEFVAAYEYVCGVRAELPWMIMGGLGGGFAGFFASRKLADGGLMGATVGVLAGIGLGAGAVYGIQKARG